MKLRSEHIKEHLGEIVHVDRAALLDDDVVARCLELLDERVVLVFPGLHLTDEEQIAFTDRLGPRNSRTGLVAGGNVEVKDVYKITLGQTNDTPEYVLGTYFWHIDGMTSKSPPSHAGLLTARSVAAKGGQTEFANTYAAYEGLSDEDKEEIAGLKAVHSLSASLRDVVDFATQEERDERDKLSTVREHPIVWTHKSGRKSLVIGTTTDRVVGRSVPEGRALLERLLEWTVQPDYVYRHQWSEGDLVIWNNTGALHRVIPYDSSSGRTVHRTAVAGTESVQ